MTTTTTDAATVLEDTPEEFRPFTGEEYLRSLDDGREVWIYGERVENVAEHPAFRNSARMIARMTGIALPGDAGPPGRS